MFGVVETLIVTSLFGIVNVVGFVEVAVTPTSSTVAFVEYPTFTTVVIVRVSPKNTSTSSFEENDNPSSLVENEMSTLVIPVPILTETFFEFLV